MNEMMTEKEREIALLVFREIESAFPNLKITLDLEHPHVEMMLHIPKQEGLVFDVSLNVQNRDELHLNAGSFWQEWFPCTDEAIGKRFIEAVTGLLAGDNRIVEHYRGKKAVKAQLQRPKGADWETIATWSCLHLPIPFRQTTKTLRNAQP